MQQQTVFKWQQFFWSTPEPMWLYLTLQHDGFSYNAIWWLKGHANSSEVFCFYPYTDWDFSGFPESFHSMVFGEILIQNYLWFCIEKCDFWFVWHKVMSHDWDRDDPFIPKHDTLAYITSPPAYCEPFQNILIWIFNSLFIFLFPLSQLNWSVLQPSKSKFVYIYKMYLCWSAKTLETFSLYFCQLNKS